MTEAEQDQAISDLQAQVQFLQTQISQAQQAVAITATEKRAHKRAILLTLIEQVYIGLTTKPQSAAQLQTLLTNGYATGVQAVADALHPGDNT